jgi:hypothetical protein
MTSRIFSKWSGAPFEISLGCRYELLVRVLDFLSYVAVVHRRGETTHVALLALLPALSTLLGAFNGDTGGCGSAAATGRTHLSQSDGGSDRLLTRGVSCCEVEQLHGGLWLLTTELVNQRAARSAILEGRDDVGISHTRELMTFL